MMNERHLITKENLVKLKNLLEKLLQILQKEGDEDVYYAKNELIKNIDYLNKSLILKYNNYNDVFNEAKKNYKNMYHPHGGLSDFFIWRDNFDERVKVNKPLENIKKEIQNLFDL